MRTWEAPSGRLSVNSYGKGIGSPKTVGGELITSQNLSVSVSTSIPGNVGSGCRSGSSNEFRLVVAIGCPFASRYSRYRLYQIKLRFRIFRENERCVPECERSKKRTLWW